MFAPFEVKEKAIETTTVLFDAVNSMTEVINKESEIPTKAAKQTDVTENPTRSTEKIEEKKTSVDQILSSKNVQQQKVTLQQSIKEPLNAFENYKTLNVTTTRRPLQENETIKTNFSSMSTLGMIDDSASHQTTTKTIENESSTEHLSTSIEINLKSFEQDPEFHTRVYYLDDSQTSTTVSSRIKYQEEQSSTESTVDLIELSSTPFPVVENVTQKFDNLAQEFVTKIYHIDDSLTSTVIVTERILTSTTENNQDHSRSYNALSIIEETKSSTETPTLSKTTQEAFSERSNASTTEKLILREGEVIILPSGKVLSGVDELQKDILHSLSEDSVNLSKPLQEAENDKITNKQSKAQLEEVTDAFNTNDSYTTLPPNLHRNESVSETPIESIELSSTIEVASSTEKIIGTETTTKSIIHQTTQLKTSEATKNEVRKVKKNNVDLDFTTLKPEEEIENQKLNVTQMEVKPSNLELENTKEEKLPLSEDSVVASNTVETISTMSSVNSEPITLEQSSQLPEEKGIEITTILVPNSPEKISTTLRNVVTENVITQEDIRSTTPVPINTQVVTNTTGRPLTESATTKELRESKDLNKTDEVTTLQWTTERNNNWTLEDSSTTISNKTLSTEALPTVESIEVITTIKYDSTLLTTDIPNISSTTTDEGVRKINLRPDSQKFQTQTNTISLKQELISNEGVKSTLNITIEPVTDAPSSSSDSEESLEVEDVPQPEEEIKICTSHICRKEGDDSSKENEP